MHCDSNMCGPVSPRSPCAAAGLRGGFPDELEYTDPSWHYVGLRTIYNLLFFIIISTLLLNIVFGIIVDTFSELRDEKFAIEDHMNNYCFICSMRSFDFQKAGPSPIPRSL